MCEELRIRRQADGQVETRELVRVLNMEYFGNPHRNVSESVATRFFHHCDISFKTNERRHMRHDLRESIDYYRKVESFDPTKAKDVDEVSISPKAFERNKVFRPVVTHKQSPVAPSPSQTLRLKCTDVEGSPSTNRRPSSGASRKYRL